MTASTWIPAFLFKFLFRIDPKFSLLNFKLFVSYTPISVPLLFSSSLFYTYQSFFRFLFSSLLFCTQPSLFHFQICCPVDAHCVVVQPIYKLLFFSRLCEYVPRICRFSQHSCTVPLYLVIHAVSSVHLLTTSPLPLQPPLSHTLR